ncbi:isocitrate lyase/PEP mutase family protein [Pseudonocardia broussonetiae]|uniref:Isocitrate lyase/PEP mutase family protein n=1 Tax=Pseudonocardia broussonetiae TaxID=2736640 RepID=A0A6M6JNS4_9PSEU|nr:isocitrate lyase/PEP mutase family protein [Pseudonocardia broussonetiae]QJY48883.1 isocitrate lyase/PEP mutase family protein [Pseudonocardia broussonetiae]
MRTTTPPASATLRAALAGPGLLRVPGVYDGISAHVARVAGFEVAFLGGAGVSASRYGVPDLGLVTGSELADAATVAASSFGGPLLVDADTGFGEVLNVTRTVESLERAGAAGIMFEDQVTSKRRCGHLSGKQVVPVEDYVAKLHAARNARRADTVIIARTDSRGPLGIDAAIDRGKTFAAEGADVVFVEAPETRHEIERIADEVTGAALMFNSVAGGRTPEIGEDELEALGYTMVVYPAAMLFPAAQAMADELTTLTGAPSQRIASPRELFETVGMSRWAALEEAGF